MLFYFKAIYCVLEQVCALKCGKTCLPFLERLMLQLPSGMNSEYATQCVIL